MAGCVEHPLQRSQFANHLRVNPELVQQIELRMGCKYTGWYEKRHRQEENLKKKDKSFKLLNSGDVIIYLHDETHPSGPSLKNTLTKSCGQVIFL